MDATARFCCRHHALLYARWRNNVSPDKRKARYGVKQHIPWEHQQLLDAKQAKKLAELAQAALPKPEDEILILPEVLVDRIMSQPEIQNMRPALQTLIRTAAERALGE